MKILLKPVPPYDFALSVSIFSTGDKQIRNYTDGVFRQAIRVNEKLVLATIKSSGSINSPELELELKSKAVLDRREENLAAGIITSMLNLNLDLRAFYNLARNDKVLQAVVRKLEGLRSPVTPTVYEALIDSIIEQQISLTVAHIMQNRLIKSYGDVLDLEEGTFYSYPNPEKLAQASIDSLQRCGLSQRKATYIRGISALIADGRLDLEKFKKYDDIDQIIKEMDEIRGIGSWTAELTAIRGIGRLDAIPADDLGLRGVISHYYFKDARITSIEVRRIASNWDLWKGLAAFYFIIASSLGIEPEI